MEQQHNIWYVTILLSAVAGYCDTVTFIAADAIFSAHVTGNFIVFAYQLIKGADQDAWVKLLTFPVFIFSVAIGGWTAKKVANGYMLLLEGLILLSASIAVIVFQLYGAFGSGWPMYLVAMMVVVAMGLQNAFGKLFSKETYGPTTMMTGNVTQAALDFGSLVQSGFIETTAWISLKKQFITIGGFLIGCVIGAIAGKHLGLEAVIIPGTAMIVCYLLTNEKKQGQDGPIPVK
ncbi:DUF1275 domain-containing protein [Pedobacter sp. HMF7647]|uniref:DUF1275 domain-containing protein n=1 Tax=Hufsiella arboris TaxID=2695275 RepID=A0A7K1Y858_9SPHI|nr:YoaK family protein [Hufsiella arboris]MXV50610.1 DUF1275 domain-containing protein [Hufsiella arboris]